MSLFTHYVEEQRGMIVRCSKSVVAVAIFGYSQCCSLCSNRYVVVDRCNGSSALWLDMARVSNFLRILYTKNYINQLITQSY